MTWGELKRQLDGYTDDAIIILHSGEGTFVESELIGVGYDNPWSEESVDACHVEIWPVTKTQKLQPGGVRDLPNDECSYVVALGPVAVRESGLVVWRERSRQKR